MSKILQLFCLTLKYFTEPLIIWSKTLALDTLLTSKCLLCLFVKVTFYLLTEVLLILIFHLYVLFFYSFSNGGMRIIQELLEIRFSDSTPDSLIRICSLTRFPVIHGCIKICTTLVKILKLMEHEITCNNATDDP